MTASFCFAFLPPYALVALASLVTEQQNNDAEREVFISGVAELMRANLMWG